MPPESLLPAKFGLIVVYAGVGFICGAGASIDDTTPTVRRLLGRGFLGFVAALIAGAACLARLGTGEQAFWWGFCICGLAGWVGPAAVVQFLKKQHKEKSP